MEIHPNDITRIYSEFEKYTFKLATVISNQQKELERLKNVEQELITTKEKLQLTQKQQQNTQLLVKYTNYKELE